VPQAVVDLQVAQFESHEVHAVPDQYLPASQMQLAAAVVESQVLHVLVALSKYCPEVHAVQVVMTPVVSLTVA